MKKILIPAFLLLCFVAGFAHAVLVQVNDVPAIVTTLTATDAVTFEAAFTLNLADPAIVFDPATATDTEFWMGITEDAGGDDDDTFQVGKGIVKGTTPFFTWNKDGGFVAQVLTDAVDAYQFMDADGGAPIIYIDSTNETVGFGTVSPITGSVITVDGGTKERSIASLSSDDLNAWSLSDNDTTGVIGVSNSTQFFGVGANLLLANGEFYIVGDGASSSIGVKNATPAGALTIGDGTKHDGYVFRDPAEVQTPANAQTTLDNVTLLDENTYHFEAYIVGVQSDGTDRASYHIVATVFRTGAGGATLQGGVTSLHSNESNGALDATFTVDTNDIRVSVTGIAAETWEWGCTVQYMNMSN